MGARLKPLHRTKAAKYSGLIGINREWRSDGGDGDAIMDLTAVYVPVTFLWWWRGYLYCWRRVVRWATPSVAFMGMTVTLEGTAAGLGSM